MIIDLFRVLSTPDVSNALVYLPVPDLTLDHRSCYNFVHVSAVAEPELHSASLSFGRRVPYRCATLDADEAPKIG